MHAGIPTGSKTRRRRSLASMALLLTMTTVRLTACDQNPDPRDWGAAAKKNFVAGCTTEVKAGGGTTTTILIASKSTCECIYDDIAKGGKYPLGDFQNLKDYEAKQQSAKAGAKPPTPPKQLTSAIKDCREAGPVAG